MATPDMSLDPPKLITELSALAKKLQGELLYDELIRRIYATDASVYREIPLAVAYPVSDKDIIQLITFAKEHHCGLIPRAAGTSLAGQCVGNGIVVDVSRHLREIIEFNEEEHWVRVQPGVIRDELNAFLKPYGLFFSPITSTANRATIGGMLGNNSSGTTSISYGVTRDHVLQLEAILSDGSQVVFGPLTKAEFEAKCRQDDLEGGIYQQLMSELSDPEIRDEIENEFPDASIHRRNTGYAVDTLLHTEPFKEDGEKINVAKLICGSEGTLAFITCIKIGLDPLPPPEDIVLAAHFNSVHDSLLATQIAMKFKPAMCELMDKTILDCTKASIEYRKHRFFIEGDPAAVLMIEFRGDTIEKAVQDAQKVVDALMNADLGYAYPLIKDEKTKYVWALRSAGLGLLANIPGDKKAVACIEDTAVSIDDLPAYIDEFSELMQGYQQNAVYYAHAGAGELHLRPILDLKEEQDRKEFRAISEASARLVKKYRGSLSGEHGDGRVRAEFIPLVVGEKNYQLFRRIKKTWDPQNVFNPGKIVDTAPMDESLRYEAGQATPEIETILDFSDQGGVLRAAEKCNGSGDCRKLALSGGTMCPSYMASLDEKDTTRARANTLREYLTLNKPGNPFDHQEIKEVLDLCLSCKGCTSECPSTVDMAALRAEFLYQYAQTHGFSLRSKAFASINVINELFHPIAPIVNFFQQNKLTGSWIKSFLKVAQQRQLPKLHSKGLRSWYMQHKKHLKADSKKSKVYLFCDEFTNYNDTEIGIKAIELLNRLGYEVEIPLHQESGRAAISKGLLHKAKQYADANVQALKDLISEETPLIGLEPSAILSFRDEYPKLVSPSNKEIAVDLAKNCYLIDEFLDRELAAGNLDSSYFNDSEKHILLHGHCHQKALSDTDHTRRILELPKNYHVTVIPSGCCGMAGSFGYEEEHYELSMKIGELGLFPALRNASNSAIVAAPGTSCRHQIMDGTGRTAMHPVEILHEALK